MTTNSQADRSAKHRRDEDEVAQAIASGFDDIAATLGDGTPSRPGRANLQAVPDDGRTPDVKPVISVSSNPDAIRKLRNVLLTGQLPDIYVSDGAPVHIERVSGTIAQAVEDDSPLPVRASTLSGPLLAHLLAHHSEVRLSSAGGAVKEWTPTPVVLGAVLASAEWPGVKVLNGIVGLPVIRRDGTLLQKAGYDEATGVYLSPKVEIPCIDEKPTAEQVADARAFILDKVLADFEWGGKPDRANYLGLLVTPFLRRYLRCLTPLGIISATMPGSGKSILAGLIGLLAGQKTLPWADDDMELRKAITSAFTVESGTVIFDNLDEGTVIKSPILANLLTNPVWSDRILGSTRIGTWVNDRMWLATGNNLRVGGDIASRGILVRLSPRAPHPEQRSGFSIPNLDEWIVDPVNRAALLRHLLVLILDWINAGAQKDATLPNMRQFTPWAQGIGGFLHHHDVPGFLSNLDELRDADEEDQKWSAFLTKWLEKHDAKPMKALQIFESAAIVEAWGSPDVDPWDGAFITSSKGRRPGSAVQLGQWLAGHERRFHGNLCLVSELDTHSKVNYWHVEHYIPPAAESENPIPANTRTAVS